MSVVSTNAGIKEPYDKTQHGEGYSEDSLYSGRVGTPRKVAPKTAALWSQGWLILLALGFTMKIIPHGPELSIFTGDLNPRRSFILRGFRHPA